MWDHALAILSSIIVIVVSSVIATFLFRRFERRGIPFSLSIRPRQRQWWIPTFSATSWSGVILYFIGVTVILFGCVLVIPTVSRLTQIADLILLLGAPMVMNGITLLVYGVIICALGKVVDLLSGSPSRLVRPNTNAESGGAFETWGYVESKVTVSCPNCAQQLRIPRGNKGIIKCPKCATKFEIDA